MATQGFELCREDHERNTNRWNGRRGGDVSESSAASSQSRRAALRAAYLNDDMTSVDSYFTGDSAAHANKSADDSGARRRRRKCLIWMMACYMFAAAIAFFSVLIWKNFADQNEDVSKLQNQKVDTTGSSDRACNGLVSNCYRRLDEIMYAGVHNAMSSRENNFLAYNNLFSMEDALMAGFRALFIDTCDCNQMGVMLCHAVCVAGFRRPIPAFAAIVDFLNNNPNEVVILELQIGQNTLMELFQVLEEVEGLKNFMYGHPFILDPLPTLGELVDMNKRLMVFQHDGGNCMQKECPPNVHDTYAYMYETPYDSESLEELMNVNRTCRISRGWPKAPFVMMNHFAEDSRGLPDYDTAVEANKASNIELKLEECQTRLNRTVINMLVVDFWNVGDVLQVVHDFNNNLPPVTFAPSESPSIAPTVLPRPSSAPIASNSASTADVATVRTEAPVTVSQSTTMPTPKPSAKKDTQSPTQFPFSEILNEIILASSAHSSEHFDYFDNATDAPTVEQSSEGEVGAQSTVHLDNASYAPTSELSAEGTAGATYDSTIATTYTDTVEDTHSRAEVVVGDENVGNQQ